jgi:hypothetical protein
MVVINLIWRRILSLGFQSGLAASSRSLAIPLFALAFSSVLLLIVDLDRAHEVLLPTSQQAMIDLQNSMQATLSTSP